ncbi:hypothetical protein ACFE04_022510 [Oxalis oulophora]
MTTLTDQQKTNKEIHSIFGEDEHMTDNESVLCYCDVPALILTTKEVNNHKRTLATCAKYSEVSDAGRCKLKVWLYPSIQIEEVSTYTMDTYKTWEEEKIAHRNARERVQYLQYLNKKLMVLPTRSVGMRSRRGRPPLKRMVCSRSTWTDKNWSGEQNVELEDDVILEGVPKIPRLGL